MDSNTRMQSHIMSMAHAALNHNAMVVQLASEVIAAGPVRKNSQMKRIRAAFDQQHQAYVDDVERIKKEIDKDVAEGLIHE